MSKVYFYWTFLKLKYFSLKTSTISCEIQIFPAAFLDNNGACAYYFALFAKHTGKIPRYQSTKEREFKMASNTTSSTTAASKPSSTDKDKETLRAVLQFLKNKKLSVRWHSFLCNQEYIQRIISYNKKVTTVCFVSHLFQETEKIFRQETNCAGNDSELNLETSSDIDTDISSVLSAYNR